MHTLWQKTSDSFGKCVPSGFLWVSQGWPPGQTPDCCITCLLPNPKELISFITLWVANFWIFIFPNEFFICVPGPPTPLDSGTSSLASYSRTPLTRTPGLSVSDHPLSVSEFQIANLLWGGGGGRGIDISWNYTIKFVLLVVVVAHNSNHNMLFHFFRYRMSS